MNGQLDIPRNAPHGRKPGRVIDAVTGTLLSSQPPPGSLCAFIDDRRFERTYLLNRSVLAAFE